MKKLVTIGLLMCMAVSLHAQRIIQTQSLKDKLLLLYEVPLQQPESNDAIVITPFLCGQQDTLALQPVYVRGEKNARKLLRDMKGKEELVPAYIPAAEVSASFAQASEISLEKYPWVKNGSLKLIVMTEREHRSKVQAIGLGYTEPFFYDYQTP